MGGKVGNAEGANRRTARSAASQTSADRTCIEPVAPNIASVQTHRTILILWLECGPSSQRRWVTDELRTPAQLVEVFLAADLKSLLDGSDDREIVAKHIEQTSDSVICTWDTLSRSNGYRVAGKIHARGKSVLRATFHDYDCMEYERSCEYFAPIISSLVLLES